MASATTTQTAGLKSATENNTSRREMSFKLRLILGFSIPLLTLMLLGSISIWALKETSLGLKTVYEDRVIPLQSLKTIADDYAVLIIDAVNKADAGLISAEDARASIKNAQSRIAKVWNSYLNTQLTPEEAQLTQEAEALFIAANQDIQQALTLLNRLSGNIKGQLDTINGPLYRSIDPISSKINQLVELQLNVAKEQYAHTKEHDRQMLILVSSLLALALSGSIASGLYIIYRLSRQLGAEPAKVRLTTQRVAQGDLTIETPQDSHASSILAAVGCMTQDLKVVVKNVKNSTQDIAALGNQLHQRTQATRDMLNTQKSETDMITSAMTEMNATVHEVAKNTAAAAEASRTVELEMEKGLRIVDDSIKSIHLLANEVHQSVQVVSQLAEDSQEIKTILSVIGDIAEQTNLLALNAAIEAARAGEQGRGFAVVADEVRTLASRTHDSTEQIQNMVQKIQSGVAQSVTVMERNEAVAQNSVTLAEQTQQSLHKISEAISTVNDMNTQIASAAEEQSLVTEEIHRNISVISTITHDSNDAFDEVWQAANNLSQMAERLDQDVAYFRL